jgi:hypothetical protein
VIEAHVHREMTRGMGEVTGEMDQRLPAFLVQHQTGQFLQTALRFLLFAGKLDGRVFVVRQDVRVPD